MKTKLLIAACLAIQLYGWTPPVLAQSATVEFTSDSYPVSAFGELTFALKLSAPLSQLAEIGVELPDSNDPFGSPWLAGYVTIPAGDTNRSVTFLAPGLAMFGGEIRLNGQGSPPSVTPGVQHTSKLVATQPEAEVRIWISEESDNRLSISISVISPTNITVDTRPQPSPRKPSLREQSARCPAATSIRPPAL